jgi:branched-subunit amino acid aminotransferase/4-amino-4-deoxychorismate lyase
MIGTHFSLNGKLLPVSEATVSIDSVEFVYGYGVYETLKVRNGVLYFPELHIERLLNSAKVIGMSVAYSSDEIIQFVRDLIDSVGQDSFNVKMLLMGKELYIFALNPHYVTEKEYRDGVMVVTFNGERQFVQAKTLNMLMSYLAYKKAKEEEAYDALLVDHEGFVREGTRTNLFFTDGKKLFTPPLADVLNGVTRITLLDALRAKGIEVEERKLKLRELGKYTGYFLTSTSSKVLPISRIDGKTFEVSPIIKDVMKVYEEYLQEYVDKRLSAAKI